MKKQKYILDNIESFEPKHIFECGQCFRWNEQQDGSYTGVVGENVLNVKKGKKNIIITGMCKDNIEKFCIDYFDLDTDYKKIKQKLSKIDDYLKKSIKYGSGIRILNQDNWEALISFIISANNNIPRIKGIIERISKKYGKKIVWNNNEYFTFPTPKELSKASIKDLRELGLGFRDVRVFETTRMVNNNIIDINKIENIEDISFLREELLKFPGVGPKVADCIMLFSMKKYNVFPIDVWVKRVMNELYGNEIKRTLSQAINSSTAPLNKETKNLPPLLKGGGSEADGGFLIPNNKQILEYAENKFGDLAGLAQQYLFYWRRDLK